MDEKEVFIRLKYDIPPKDMSMIDSSYKMINEYPEEVLINWIFRCRNDGTAIHNHQTVSIYDIKTELNEIDNKIPWLTSDEKLQRKLGFITSAVAYANSKLYKELYVEKYNKILEDMTAYWLDSDFQKAHQEAGKMSISYDQEKLNLYISWLIEELYEYEKKNELVQ